MNSHLHTFSTSFYDNNVFCPRCLSYISIENIESHTNQHDNTIHFTDNIFPRFTSEHSLRNRFRTQTTENPFTRLSRLHGIHTLHNTLQNTLQNTMFNGHGHHSHNSEDEDDEEDDTQTFQYELNMYISNMLGDVEVGIGDISKVSQLVEDSNIDCHICLEKVTTPRKLICNHVYCDQCISQWLEKNKKCPVCRVDLEEALKNIEKIED